MLYLCFKKYILSIKPLREAPCGLCSPSPVTEDRRVSEAIDVVVEVRSRQHCPLITCWNEKKTQTGQTVDPAPTY